MPGGLRCQVGIVDELTKAHSCHDPPASHDRLLPRHNQRPIIVVCCPCFEAHARSGRAAMDRRRAQPWVGSQETACLRLLSTGWANQALTDDSSIYRQCLIFSDNLSPGLYTSCNILCKFSCTCCPGCIICKA